MRAATVLTLALVVVTDSAFAEGAATPIQTDRRALVMLRVLAYDTHLDRRTHDAVNILIVHPRGEEGDACAARWGEAFDKVRKMKIAGRAIQVVAHESADLDRTVTELDVTALVACEGVTRELPVTALAKLTRAHQILSFAMREDDVVAGLSVAVVPGRDAEKPRDEIVVNPRAAAAEGVKFDAGLMQLARTAGEP